MPRDKIEGLISELHDRIADSETSPEQEELLARMKSQLAGWEGETPADGDLRTTAEMLVDELEESHPTLAALVKDIIQTLHNAGL